MTRVRSKISEKETADRRLEANRETDIRKKSFFSNAENSFFIFFVLGSTGVIQRYRTSYINREIFHAIFVTATSGDRRNIKVQSCDEELIDTVEGHTIFSKQPSTIYQTDCEKASQCLLFCFELHTVQCTVYTNLHT